AMTLIGAVLVVIAVNTDRKQAILNQHEEALLETGNRLLDAWQSKGSGGLAQAEIELETASGHPSWLLNNQGAPVSGRHIPQRARRLAHRAADLDQVEIRPSPRGIWFAIPLSESNLVLTRVPPPSRFERFLNPHQLGIRLLVTFVIAGLVCYFLARSLAAPLSELRKATSRLADGDLGSRVADKFANRRDETAELARDFNRMAGRIDSLVQSQKRLLVDISHELRTPLTRLQLALELARHQQGTEQEGNLDRIAKEADRLNDLIGQLRTLTLLESGENSLQREQLKLHELLQEIVKDADIEARQRDCRVEVLSLPQIELMGSGELLRRTFENVVRNALRYAPGGSSIALSLALEDDVAVTTVRDQGPGVPEKDLPHLFEPFYRVAESRDRECGGTGLGLAIAARSVRLHGGSIAAENPTNGGLLVRIGLPL
ncbi:MAG: two-component sensor histidine kinase, partial [Desulfuromonas sp.]